MTLNGDHLEAQLTGQQAIRIYAESDAVFFFKVVDAEIRFDTSARPAPSLILRQSGRELKATRK